MKPSEVTELVAILVAAFPRPPIGEKTIEVYEKMLVDLDRELAHRACARLITTSKWLPTIAEIRAAATELTLGPRRQGGEAWGDLSMAIRLYGRYQSPTFDDPVVAECVRQMGWLALCDATNDSADRARFIELYDGLALRRRADEVAGPGLALPAPTRRNPALSPRPDSHDGTWIPAGRKSELETARDVALRGLARLVVEPKPQQSVPMEYPEAG